MSDGHEATGTRQTWMGVIVMLAALLVASAGPSHAWGGAHGFRGPHGFRGAHHGFRRARVFIAPSIVVPTGPFWAPYWEYWTPYGYPPAGAYPPVYAPPSPPAVVPPAASQTSWYYCHNPPGYYPYVQQCPGGWRQVAPTPQ